jgi:hypothetical protein
MHMDSASPGILCTQEPQGPGLSGLRSASSLTRKLGDQLQQDRQHGGTRAPEVVQQSHQVGQPAAQVLPQHAQQPRQPGSRKQQVTGGTG